MEAPDSASFDFGELEEQGNRRVTVSDEIKSLQHAGIKPDSFTVDMERFSHLSHKDVIPNSRITDVLKLQRSLSRKGGEKMTSPPTAADERGAGVASAASPRAAVSGGTPDKSMLVSVGTSDEAPAAYPTHHQITIMTGQIGSTTAASAAMGESRLSGKRFSFRRSPPPWTIDPRRVLLFFATLSSMGTIILIFFTLSMGKLGGDGNPIDQ